MHRKLQVCCGATAIRPAKPPPPSICPRHPRVMSRMSPLGWELTTQEAGLDGIVSAVGHHEIAMRIATQGGPLIQPLPKPVRQIWLVLHVVCSVGWIGVE